MHTNILIKATSKYKRTLRPMTPKCKDRRVQGLGHSDQTRSSSETESRIAGEPVAVSPVPVQDNLAFELDQVRHAQAAIRAPYDRAPKEHRFTREQLAEDSDALGLDSEPILQVQTGGECVAFLQVLVDGVADDRPALLVVVKPLVNLREVVLSGSREFKLGVHHLVHPVGVGQLDRAVHPDDEVQHGFRQQLGNDRGRNLRQRPLARVHTAHRLVGVGDTHCLHQVLDESIEVARVNPGNCETFIGSLHENLLGSVARRCFLSSEAEL